MHQSAVNRIDVDSTEVNRIEVKRTEVNPTDFNQFVVQGVISELSPLRYTPAGVPVLEFSLLHESEVTEAGQPRRISFSIGVLAMGDLAQMAGTMRLGCKLRLQGFLAPVRKDSQKYRLHAQHIQQI